MVGGCVILRGCVCGVGVGVPVCVCVGRCVYVCYVVLDLYIVQVLKVQWRRDWEVVRGLLGRAWCDVIVVNVCSSVSTHNWAPIVPLSG